MENIDLVGFMQRLVNNPEKLRQYKQDPSAYLKQTHPDLDPTMHELLINFSSASPLEEISTVFQLTIEEVALGDEKIDLSNLKVDLSAPTSSIIIEQTIQATGEDRPLVNRLLSHSCIRVYEQQTVHFQLHPCYVTPHDHIPKPFMFRIMTTLLYNPNYDDTEVTVIDTTDAQIQLSTHKPMVLAYNQSVTRTLLNGSSYTPDPQTPGKGTVTLNLIPDSNS